MQWSAPWLTWRLPATLTLPSCRTFRLPSTFTFATNKSPRRMVSLLKTVTPWLKKAGRSKMALPDASTVQQGGVWGREMGLRVGEKWICAVTPAAGRWRSPPQCPP